MNLGYPLKAHSTPGQCSFQSTRRVKALASPVAAAEAVQHHTQVEMHIQGGANCDTLCNDTIVTISSHIYQKGPGTFLDTKVPHEGADNMG